ncbi:hypothetical protein [Pseudomonas sp.]|uniref:hypothetical protein n=1 Tax=Pseudomonas sp. TaxID=306 RepID=UPI003F3E1965
MSTIDRAKGPVQQPLEHYWVAAATQLPQADAQGLRTFKGRQYAEVPGGHIVHVGLDPATGQYRARLSSELQPSGPVLLRQPGSELWHPLELSRPELAASAIAMTPYTPEELNVMRLAVPYLPHSNQIGSYHRANNGKYPLRDRDGRPVRIRKLETKVTLDSGKQYTSEQVKPYIKFEGFEEVGRLYEEKLRLRTFTESDVKVPGEKALIGQSMVVANRPIANGEIVAVYGGTLVPASSITIPRAATFTMSAGAHLSARSGQLELQQIAIVGDNISSRINTHFEYDATGKPLRQAAGGYNVETVDFKVEADQLVGDRIIRKHYVLNAIFATQDIPTGMELRLDYAYTEGMIRDLFS